MNSDLLENSSVNAHVSPSFELGYTGPSPLSLTERQRVRELYDAADVEKALAVFFAVLLDAAVGKELFYGCSPENMTEYFSVNLLPCNAGKNCSYWEGKAVLKGYSASHLKLIRSCGKILNFLPLGDWVTVNSAIQQNAVTFCRIDPLESAEKFPVNLRGTHGYSAEIEFSLRVCITPPPPEFSA